eukprot:1144495-Rhodomonas_salina.2
MALLFNDIGTLLPAALQPDVETRKENENCVPKPTRAGGVGCCSPVCKPTCAGLDARHTRSRRTRATCCRLRCCTLLAVMQHMMYADACLVRP